ncbi:hypothetical protein [Burkholderia sp. Ac-20365]|uniref:hypothetical protein n=1 Tax=Burkholderia sp. Ac-20365 TaxID=2703897 RepID=UPI00197C34F0|nr:hypothetical protein [Burkholderia sp. Ac-20365]MBN3762368.1 hypothetical protein [Burkholderia sp. Ac-20365]
MYAGQEFNIESGGFTFRVKIVADTDMGAPWKEHDGHGEVSEWTGRDKRPGEIVLCTDRRSRRYYDWQVSMKIARRDGWGLCDEDKTALIKSLAAPGIVGRGTHQGIGRPGRDPAKPLTQGEITAEAVRRDFAYLRGWCNDDWQWVGVVVELLDEDGEVIDDVNDSLWGIESGADDYLRETAQGMAEGLATGLHEKARERMYWNARDMVTV